MWVGTLLQVVLSCLSIDELRNFALSCHVTVVAMSETSQNWISCVYGLWLIVT